MIANREKKHAQRARARDSETGVSPEGVCAGRWQVGTEGIGGGQARKERHRLIGGACEKHGHMLSEIAGAAGLRYRTISRIVNAK